MRIFIIAVIVAMLLVTCSGHPWGSIKQKFRRHHYQKVIGGAGGGQNNGGQNNRGQNGGGQNGGGQNGGGQNGGGQNGGNGPRPNGPPPPRGGGHGPMNPGQWLNLLQTNCTHLNLTAIAEQKVTPTAVMDVLEELYYVVEGAAANFSEHSDFINALAGGLEGQTLIELVASHTVLITHFLDLVKAASDAGLCPFGHLGVLLQSLQFNGGEGFSEMDSCDESFLAVQNLTEQYGSMEAAYSSISATWLHAFGGHIRRDMACINQDIRNFERHINETRRDAESDHASSGLTMRRVQLDIATINAYAGILDREIRRLKRAVRAVGTALNNIDIAALEAPGRRDMGRIIQLLKLLRTA